MPLVLNRAASESGAKSWLGGPTGVTMQTWVTGVVTLATLMVATVDAKIYERCELAVKLEKAGLNGFRGYSVGDCETPVPQVPPTPRATHHTQTQAPFSFITSLGQGMILSATP